MPDLTTLPFDALTVLPDGTVWARTPAALDALPDGTVIRDGEMVGQLSTIVQRSKTRGRDRVVFWVGRDYEDSLADVVFDPVLGVEVIAGPRKRALS
ncbi:hypothetical protein ACT17_32720 [Mycolicibacterium conceptionense]|uniref:Uncharacterized protein n=1 Tax=Mycolicibacterium conceptionense TaxID=451644 RepID=A0A0J8TWY5_9MYCO|nr:hypothetical protein [Mycolicibacterium conceptionense]KMV13946.1 hypothetical protein ACT17_32720 [Mycolicibacterium conceptionense]